MSQSAHPQETNLVAKAKRRSFTAKHKREIFGRAEACTQSGEVVYAPSVDWGAAPAEGLIRLLAPSTTLPERVHPRERLG